MIKNADLRRQVAQINDLIARVPTATGGDLELQAHWARYLCVLAAGFLENALFETYSSVVYAGASPAVASFAASRLENISNPKASRFVETARAFKPNWADELETFLADDARKDAIDSIMANRHLIAHGKQSGITIARLRAFFDRSVAVVEFIERQCGV